MFGSKALIYLGSPGKVTEYSHPSTVNTVGILLNCDIYLDSYNVPKVPKNAKASQVTENTAICSAGDNFFFRMYETNLDIPITIAGNTQGNTFA